MGERGHAAASLWLEHAPSIGLAIGPRQQDKLKRERREAKFKDEK